MGRCLLSVHIQEGQKEEPGDFLEEVHGVLSWDQVTRTHKAKQIESKQSKRLHCTSNIYYTCLYIGFFLIYWDKLRTM